MTCCVGWCHRGQWRAGWLIGRVEPHVPRERSVHQGLARTQQRGSSLGQELVKLWPSCLLIPKQRVDARQSQQSTFAHGPACLRTLFSLKPLPVFKPSCWSLQDWRVLSGTWKGVGAARTGSKACARCRTACTNAGTALAAISETKQPAWKGSAGNAWQAAVKRRLALRSSTKAWAGKWFTAEAAASQGEFGPWYLQRPCSPEQKIAVATDELSRACGALNVLLKLGIMVLQFWPEVACITL